MFDSLFLILISPIYIYIIESFGSTYKSKSISSGNLFDEDNLLQLIYEKEEWNILGKFFNNCSDISPLLNKKPKLYFTTA